jgi:hypothetical protein
MFGNSNGSKSAVSLEFFDPEAPSRSDGKRISAPAETQSEQNRSLTQK